MTRSLSAVIFDFHGVLTESALPGLALPELADDPARGAALEELETGRIGMADFLARLPPRPPSGRSFHLTVRPGLVGRAAQLRAHGVKIALLTNTFRGFAGIRARSGVSDSLFDVVVESWRYGMRKPTPELYLITARQLDTDPGQCAFLDDDQRNVAAAAAVGMSAFHVLSEAAALDWLGRHFPAVQAAAPEAVG
jgi:putative hydrolase of the HAD superfamily